MSKPDARVVAHRWLRNGEATFMGWISGVPSERSLQSQRECNEIEGVTWTVEYAIPESLLAEAEREVARLTSCLSQANILIEQFERDWYMACDERDRNAAQRDALQSRLDAVGRLADELETRVEDWSCDMKDAAFAQLNDFPDKLRSAALGGESPANEEERK